MGEAREYNEPMTIAPSDSPTPPPNATPETGGAPQTVSRLPDHLASCAYLFAILFTGGLSLFSGKGLTAFLDAGLFLTAGLFGFVAFRHGILHELRWFMKMGSALACGWFGKDLLVRIFGLSGLSGTLIGFYSFFILTYLLTGYLLKRLIPEGPPTFAGRWLGLTFGALEGGMLFALLIYVLPFAAPAGPAGTATDGLGSRLANAIMEPLSQRVASTPLVLLQIAHEARSGIDPTKIDHQTLNRQFEPIRNNPKIRAIAEDPDLARLLAAKDVKNVLRHPKVIALYSDPEVQKLGSTIDWQAVAKALRQGIPPAGTRLPESGQDQVNPR